MTELKYPKPDYKHWAKMDTWSLHQSAFLLHDIDPLEVRGVKLTAKKLEPEFKEIQKTYLLLQGVPWRERHTYYYLSGTGTHPVAIIFEARKKDLPVPAKLLKLVRQRMKREENEKIELEKIEKQQQELIAQREEKNADNNKKSLPEQSLSSRERKNLLKAIGVLVNVLMDERAKSKHSNRGAKLSALQISQMMLEKAEHLGIEIEGLKSFDRKITEALELLQEELK